MKLGMPQLFEYERLEDNFKFAKKLDLDFIEFNLNFDSCRKGLENGQLKDLAEQYNVGVTFHFYDEADLGSYDEVVKAYLNLLEKSLSFLTLSIIFSTSFLISILLPPIYIIIYI